MSLNSKLRNIGNLIFVTLVGVMTMIAFMIKYLHDLKDNNEIDVNLVRYFETITMVFIVTLFIVLINLLIMINNNGFKNSLLTSIIFVGGLIGLLLYIFIIILKNEKPDNRAIVLYLIVLYIVEILIGILTLQYLNSIL